MQQRDTVAGRMPAMERARGTHTDTQIHVHTHFRSFTNDSSNYVLNHTNTHTQYLLVSNLNWRKRGGREGGRERGRERERRERKGGREREREKGSVYRNTQL